MNLAIVSVSLQGQKLAEQLKSKLEDDPTIFKVDLYHKDVKNTLKFVFKKYDVILGIMATGIMVRSLCNLIDHKTRDPAVLVMDEASHNVISLLSGHLGGANYITKKIADLTNSNAVITTATDVHGLLGIDELARKYFFKIKNPEMILDFNKALLQGNKIHLTVSEDLAYFLEDPEVIHTYNTDIIDQNKKKSLQNANDTNENTVTVTLDEEELEKELELKPHKFVVGIGSRKGVSKDQVLQAIINALIILNLPLKRIDTISTAEIKNQEQGIIETAAYLQVPLEIISLQDIKKHQSGQCSHSKFVEEKFGIKGVCEPVALISAGNNSKLIFKKTPYNGVTVAIAISQ